MPACTSLFPRTTTVAALLGLGLVAILGATETQTKSDPTAGPDPALKAEPIRPAVWKGAPRKAVTSAEIDQMVVSALQKAGVKTAPIVGDEQFIRRVYLDLCGKPPTAAKVREFVADSRLTKRALLIDQLLESDAYAKHWSRYWHDVMAARFVNVGPSRILARSFERWMAEQLKKNRPWSEITQDMITATGVARYDDTEGKAGPAFFLASHMGMESPMEQAAETARVFMGIQINCAQCHNHPFDSWKREQFHELAAYFARVRTRLVRDPDADAKMVRFIGVELVSTDRFGGMGKGGFGMMRGMGNEYRMPGKDDPKTGTVMHPRSLDGKAPGKGLKDADRRKALAESIVSKDNQWFAAAYVNRIWGVLLGQAFYQPLDDLGPEREAYHGAVLARLSASFAAGDYDIKQLFRVILNTETYQRESRMGASAAEHLLFAASYPTRLRPSAVWESLNNALGGVGGGGVGRGGPGMFGGMGGPFAGGLEGMVRNEFAFDPSLKNDDIEGSIPQALTLMNNPQLNQKIRAQGTNVVAKILKSYEGNAEAIEAVYLQALCRKPSVREVAKCQGYVKKVGSRAEAFEDILWALINSTEFQTRR